MKVFTRAPFSLWKVIVECSIIGEHVVYACIGLNMTLHGHRSLNKTATNTKLAKDKEVAENEECSPKAYCL